jgi:hypothetical protein
MLITMLLFYAASVKKALLHPPITQLTPTPHRDAPGDNLAIATSTHSRANLAKETPIDCLHGF